MQPVIKPGKKAGEENNEKDSDAEYYKTINGNSSIILFLRDFFESRA